MKFGSVCSGIEAASVAWHPLGWRAAWLAEIEPFPSAALAHHYPEVPNLGDMTHLPEQIVMGEIEAPDLFCGGTPCQAFSVAGLRKSLDDARGNLSLTFCEIANAIDISRAHDGLDPCIVFWENVPGVLNTKDNAFGCFLAGLAGEDDALEPPGGKWSNAGAVFGPQRAVAWRVLDAQYFGVAQRRRRVFVVASARDRFDPAAVLFEFDGLRRDTAPSREAREDTTRSVAPCLTGNYGKQPDSSDTSGGPMLIPSTGNISHCLNAGGMGRQDYETETLVTHSLRGEGFDASEDGTGRGTPLVPISFGAQMSVPQVDFNLNQTLQAKNPMAVAFSSKDFGGDATTELSPTLRAMPHSGSRANGGGQMAVAFHENQRAEVTINDTTGTLNSGGGKPGQGYPAAIVGALSCNTGPNGHDAGNFACNQGVDAGHVLPTQTMQVRRLTPRECERLMGFPDDYTFVPYRNKPAADGPRYKALGNSWAVPNVRWIGWRIAGQVFGDLA